MPRKNKSPSGAKKYGFQMTREMIDWFWNRIETIVLSEPTMVEGWKRAASIAGYSDRWRVEAAYGLKQTPRYATYIRVKGQYDTQEEIVGDAAGVQPLVPEDLPEPLGEAGIVPDSQDPLQTGLSIVDQIAEMTRSTKYMINTIEDLRMVPVGKRDKMLSDLGEWLKLMDALEDLGALKAAWYEAYGDGFIWLDAAEGVTTVSLDGV